MNTIEKISRGTLIDNRYKVEKILGQGGFGRTYLISDRRRFGELCVLKEFVSTPINHVQVNKSRQLFQQEAAILYQLDHPQIPRFFDWFEEQGRLFLVQQYIEGQNYWELLQQRRQNNQVFSETEIIEWLKNLLTVLDYIHSRNLIHRDIAPDNIILPYQKERPVLIDFGVVKEVVNQLEIAGQSIPGSRIGKPGYSPPEQLLMGKCYPNSDLYALAVTALVLLTGKEPEELFDSYQGIWQWHKYANISEHLASILTKMLAKTPQDRYQSSQEILTILTTNSTPNNFCSKPSVEKDIQENSPLPQPTVVIKSENQSKSTNLLPLISILIVTSLGVFLGLKSPYVIPICKALDNCVRDREYNQKYHQIREEGKQAVIAGDNAQTIYDLESNRDRLENVINRLQQIPEDVKIYSDAQQTISNYQIELNKFDNKLTKEKKVQEKFIELDNQKNKLIKITKRASTKEEYKRVKLEWIKLEKQSQNISPDVFIAEQLQQIINQSEVNIKEIDTKIAEILVEEKRQQEEEAESQKIEITEESENEHFDSQDSFHQIPPTQN